MQRYPLFKIYSRPSSDPKKGHLLNTETSPGSKKVLLTFGVEDSAVRHAHVAVNVKLATVAY